jgi:hypothetical protein
VGSWLDADQTFHRRERAPGLVYYIVPYSVRGSAWLQWIFEEFRITIAKQTLSRELRAMGYRKLSARPRHHAQAVGAIEDFKKTSPRAWARSRTTRRSTSRP